MNQEITKNVTYAENRFDSTDHKVVIFWIEVMSKTDDSQDEDEVEKEGPVSQHGNDQGKGETAEDTAEKDKREKFCWITTNIGIICSRSLPCFFQLWSGDRSGVFSSAPLSCSQRTICSDIIHDALKPSMNSNTTIWPKSLVKRMHIQDQLRSFTYNKNPEGLTRRHVHLGKCDCKSASSTFYSFVKKTYQCNGLPACPESRQWIQECGQRLACKCHSGL